MISFISMVLDFLTKLLTIEIVGGISLHTILFFNLYIISFWVVFTRRS